MHKHLRTVLTLLLLLGISSLKERIRMIRKLLAALCLALLFLALVPMVTWAHGGAQSPLSTDEPGYDNDGGGD